MQDDGKTAHLSVEQLASYIDGSLTPDERDRVLTHFDQCAECRREMTASRRVIARAPGAALRSRWRTLSPAFAMLAAAALVFVVASPVLRNNRGRDVAVRAPTRIAESDNAPRLATVSPADEGAASPENNTFVWRAASGDAEYRLTITDATGRIVWRKSTTDTSAVLPDSVRFVRGNDYYWSVEALLADGRSATTNARHFSVR